MKNVPDGLPIIGRSCKLNLCTVTKGTVMEISEVTVYSDDGLVRLEYLTVGEVFLNDFVSNGVLIIDGTTYRNKTRFDIMESKKLQKLSAIQNNSVTLSSVIIALIVCNPLYFSTIKLQSF